MRLEKTKELIIVSVIAFVLGLAVMIGGGLAGTGDPLYDGKTAQTVTGKLNTLRIPANSVQYLSGASIFGTAITGVSNPARSPLSGVSLVMTSPSGGENVWFYLGDNTAQSGNTIYLHFTPGDTVVCNQDIIPGVSKFELSGTSLAQTVACWSDGVSRWVVKTDGSPTVNWD